MDHNLIRMRQLCRRLYREYFKQRLGNLSSVFERVPRVKVTAP